MDSNLDHPCADHPCYISSKEICQIDKYKSTWILYDVTYKPAPLYEGGRFYELYRDGGFVENTEYRQNFSVMKWITTIIDNECGSDN